MFSFKKNERLCNKRLIAELYTSRNKLMCYPLSVRWANVEKETTAARLQVLFVAPKKKLRHAVDRNRTKRLMRECWRVRKQSLLETLENQDRSIIIGINYIHDELSSYGKMCQTFDKLVSKLQAELEKND